MSEFIIDPNNYFSTIPYVPSTHTRAQFETWRDDTIAKYKNFIGTVPKSLEDIARFSLDTLEVPFYLLPAMMIYTIGKQADDKDLSFEETLEFYNCCDQLIPIKFACDPEEKLLLDFNHDHLKKLDIEQIAENAHPVESGAGMGWSVNPAEIKE